MKTSIWSRDIMSYLDPLELAVSISYIFKFILQGVESDHFK